jgi:hypothetical protein
VEEKETEVEEQRATDQLLYELEEEEQRATDQLAE